MSVDIHWLKHPLGASGCIAKGNPFIPRSDYSLRAPFKSTAAVRTDVMQNVLHAVGAKRTFKGTDHRDGAVGGQIDVAVFAVGL